MIQTIGSSSRGGVGRSLALRLGLALATVWPGMQPVSAADAPGPEEPKPAAESGSARTGSWIRVSLPLDGHGIARVRRAVRQSLEGAAKSRGRPVLVFEFDIPRDAAGMGRGTSFGDAYDLASFLSSDELNSATTVAYLPKSIQGHAVLLALACDQIIMSKGASIRSAGVDEKVINGTHFSAYREIANGRRVIPFALALGLLSPTQDVMLVNTEAGPKYVTPAELEQLKNDLTITSQPEPLIRKGEPAQFSAEELRRLGFVKHLAENRVEVAQALGLPPDAVEEDPSHGEAWRAVRIELKGPVTARKVDDVQRMIQEEVHVNNRNFICLWLDSKGGAIDESIRLAQYLEELDPSAVRTVAYIPEEARADAILIALACDQIVMRNEAVLGGPGAEHLSDDIVKLAGETIRKRLAPAKGRWWSLWAAMLDPHLEVYKCVRPSETGYFCDEELKEQARPGAGEANAKWNKLERVTTPGVAFRIGGIEAAQYHLIRAAVEDFGDFKRLYELPDDPKLVEPGWADLLIAALRSPGVAALLVLLGVGGVYLELHSPGVGLGGMIAAVCFVLFLWSQYFDDSPRWLIGMLFLTGVACLLLEFFVLPGFGVLGIGGGIMVLASLVLASQLFVMPRDSYQMAELRRMLLVVGAATCAMVAAALVLRRYAPRTPFLERVFLPPPAGEEAEILSQREKLVDLENLRGVRGTAATQLTPGGKARFGNLLVDVTADEFVPRNTPVEVVEVHGNRVMVKAVAPDPSVG